jgi:glycosyltransferase involved in cell wall biosynthesis
VPKPKPIVVSVFGVAPRRIGGTETYARELSIQLANSGRQSVLCFLGKPTEQVESFLKSATVSMEVLTNAASVNVAAARSLAAILNRYRPEILHLHFTGFLGLYPWLAHFRSVRKVYFTDHTSRPAGHLIQRAPLWKRLLARAINRQLTKVVCVSEYGYRCITGLDLLPLDRFKLIYNGVDLSRVTPGTNLAAEFRQRYSIPFQRAIVLQVSWIIPEKGIAEMLQVARQVLSKTQNVQFVLVGDGAFRDQYMREAQELGIANHITWTGMVEDPFAEGVYDAADVVCQLSNWEEVFGWMIAEAMAYQKPVVATRVGGIPELVRDSVSGFLVEKGDIHATAEKIIQLLESPDLRRRMGNAGSQIAKDKFELRRNVSKLIELYDLK